MQPPQPHSADNLYMTFSPSLLKGWHPSWASISRKCKELSCSHPFWSIEQEGQGNQFPSIIHISLQVPRQKLLGLCEEAHNKDSTAEDLGSSASYSVSLCSSYNGTALWPSPSHCKRGNIWKGNNTTLTITIKTRCPQPRHPLRCAGWNGFISCPPRLCLLYYTVMYHSTMFSWLFGHGKVASARIWVCEMMPNNVYLYWNAKFTKHCPIKIQDQPSYIPDRVYSKLTKNAYRWAARNVIQTQLLFTSWVTLGKTLNHTLHGS